MDPTTLAMFMGASSGGGLRPGEFYQGGYFAGFISHTANGVPTHGLIVDMFSANNYRWQFQPYSQTSATSQYDGAHNTAILASDGTHYAATWCQNLVRNGYTDWYLPATYELEIAYSNLKPTTQNNDIDYGSNPYSVPKRTSNYTQQNPAQTDASDFVSGGARAFPSDYHWTSTDSSLSKAQAIGFQNGYQALIDKQYTTYIRAFRKFSL